MRGVSVEASTESGRSRVLESGDADAAAVRQQHCNSLDLGIAGLRLRSGGGREGD
jgi:hypothetical protein